VLLDNSGSLAAASSMWPARGVNHNHVDTLHVGYRHSEQSIEKKKQSIDSFGDGWLAYVGDWHSMQGHFTISDACRSRVVVVQKLML